MGKLIYSAHTSLDGYTVDASGSFDFTAPDEEVHEFVNDRERDVGTYLFGRRMYETMSVWDTWMRPLSRPWCRTSRASGTGPTRSCTRSASTVSAHA